MGDASSERGQKRLGRVSTYLLTALCVVGVYVSFELLSVHVGLHYGGTKGDTGLCNAIEGLSCAAAAQSKYATFLSLPIAALGVAFYLTLFVLIAMHRFLPGRLAEMPDVFVASTGLSALYSIFLGVVSVTELGKLCPLCVGLYGVNVGLFVVALIGHTDGLLATPRRLLTLPARSAFWAATLVMAVCVLFAQGIYAKNASAASRARIAEQSEKQKFVAIEPGDAPGMGASDAAIVLIEFSDFQCPHCRRLAETFHRMVGEIPDLRVHFRHYPMDQACNSNIERPFHKHACDAAFAAVCAERNGKFWPMHDALFGDQQDMDRRSLLDRAARIGLDPEAFDQCLDDPAVRDRVKVDIDEARKHGVRGTPTFFVNGQEWSGAMSVDELQSVIETARRRSGALEAMNH